jgi:hypothetical protein
MHLTLLHFLLVEGEGERVNHRRIKGGGMRVKRYTTVRRVVATMLGILMV